MSSTELVSQIKHLKSKEVAFAFGFFLAVLAPGFLTLYQFKPEVVSEYATVKLIIFSVAITLPIFAFNLIITGMYSTESLHKDQTIPWITSSFITTFSFYPSILITYILDLKFAHFLIPLFFINFLFLAVAVNRIEKFLKEVPAQTQKDT